MKCPELLNPEVVQESVDASRDAADVPTSAVWSEEECRNVAAFFMLLDQWDRNLNEKVQVA